MKSCTEARSIRPRSSSSTYPSANPRCTGSILPIVGHGRSGTVESVIRVGIMFAVALPLAAADLVVKASEPTQPWAYHQRSIGWLVFCLSLLAALVLIIRIPSVLIAPAA